MQNSNICIYIYIHRGRGHEDEFAEEGRAELGGHASDERGHGMANKRDIGVDAEPREEGQEDAREGVEDIGEDGRATISMSMSMSMSMSITTTRVDIGTNVREITHREPIEIARARCPPGPVEKHDPEIWRRRGRAWWFTRM